MTPEWFEEPMNPNNLVEWLELRLPSGFYLKPPDIFHEPDEVAILGTLPEPEEDLSPGDRRAAELARIAEHRKKTRPIRTSISKALTKEVQKPVAWGARCGKSELFFGSRRGSLVVRLDRTERRILDLLVKAQVAKSQSDAIAWALRALEDDRAEWFAELRAAVDRLSVLQRSGKIENR
jgi:hypothetical protein